MHFLRGFDFSRDETLRPLCGAAPDRVIVATRGDGLRAAAHACEKLTLIEQTPLEVKWNPCQPVGYFRWARAPKGGAAIATPGTTVARKSHIT